MALWRWQLPPHSLQRSWLLLRWVLVLHGRFNVRFCTLCDGYVSVLATTKSENTEAAWLKWESSSMCRCFCDHPGNGVDRDAC